MRIFCIVLSVKRNLNQSPPLPAVHHQAFLSYNCTVEFLSLDPSGPPLSLDPSTSLQAIDFTPSCPALDPLCETAVQHADKVMSLRDFFDSTRTRTLSRQVESESDESDASMRAVESSAEPVQGVSLVFQGESMKRLQADLSRAHMPVVTSMPVRGGACVLSGASPCTRTP